MIGQKYQGSKDLARTTNSPTSPISLALKEWPLITTKFWIATMTKIFKNDPVSQMDMQVRRSFSRRCIVPVITKLTWVYRISLQLSLRDCAAHNTNNFGSIVDELTPEEILVVRRVVGGGN